VRRGPWFTQVRDEQEVHMSVFNREALDRPDWEIFQDGWVMLYWRPELLDGVIDELVVHQYRVVAFDCERWSTPADALSDLGVSLDFPGYYGQNLNALNDCLRDIDVPEVGGVALVFRRFDRFAAQHHVVAHAILDICAHNARGFMLFGRRFATLVQSDDPALSFPTVGATPVAWNRGEWLRKDRGL